MNYVFVVSGFTQKRNNIFDNGSHAVHEALLCLQSPECSVRLVQWKEDPRGHARRVAATTSQSDVIAVSGYSYGGGWWFRVFSEELAKLGRTVDVAVLCDPQLRRPIPILNIPALIPGVQQQIPIGSNVHSIGYFYQTQNRPGNNRLKLLSSTTQLLFEKELPMVHSLIDNSDEWKQASVDYIGAVLAPAEN